MPCSLTVYKFAIVSLSLTYTFKSLTLETLLGAELKAARHLGEILAASCMVLQTSNPTKLTAKENTFTLLFGFLVVRFIVVCWIHDSHIVYHTVFKTSCEMWDAGFFPSSKQEDHLPQALEWWGALAFLRCQIECPKEMLQAEGTTLAHKALDRSEEAMIASEGLEACFLTKETSWKYRQIRLHVIQFHEFDKFWSQRP